MKNFQSVFLFLLFLISVNPVQGQIFKKKAKVEKIAAQCEGLKLSERPTIVVSRFEVSTRKAKQVFGAEMAAMLSNALVNTGCFNVLANGSEMKDIADDIVISQQFGGAGAEAGPVKSAQYFITGQITEFEENHHGTNTLGIRVGAYKAHIGFVLQIKNAQREIIFSKSLDKTRIKPGTGGITVFNFPVATASFTSKAMAEALERGIIDAVEILVEQKDQLEMEAPKENKELAFDPAKCALLVSGNAPKVMVIIPETHIQRRIPDPAGETEIIKKLTNAGFPVVDPTMYMAIKNNGEINAIVKDPVKAASIGAEYGADVIIIGEAFSQATGNVNGMVSCRARVEARAIDTRTGIIVGADGRHGSGLDIAEMVSAKTALRNAGSSIGDFFLVKFCEKGMQGGSGGSTQTKLVARGGSNMNAMKQIVIKNADFKLVSNLSKFLKAKSNVSDVSKKFSGGEGTIRFGFDGDMDSLVEELMSGNASSQIEVVDFSDNKVVLKKN